MQRAHCIHVTFVTFTNNSTYTDTVTRGINVFHVKEPAVSRAADVCRGLSATAREHAPTTHRHRDTQTDTDTQSDMQTGGSMSLNHKPPDITDIQRDIHRVIQTDTDIHTER